MSSFLDGGNLPSPPSPFKNRQTAYKRRAYGSVSCVGNDQYSCGGGSTLSFNPTPAGKKYASGGALQARGGGRYTPNAHLTSITTKNQGSGDISDSALWQVEFQYTCYSTSQLNDLASSFMIPGNLINVTIGYDPGDKFTISNARLHNFSWTYNADNATYSVTGKCLGVAGNGVLAAITVKASDKPAVGKDEGDDEVKSFSVISKLNTELDKALGLSTKDGKVTGASIPSTDGRAVSKGDYGVAKLQKQAGFFSKVFSGGSADDIIIPMVKIGRVLSFFNELISKNLVYNDIKYKQLPLLVSADPQEFCLPGAQGNYGERNDMSGLNGTFGSLSDVWVSIPKLTEVEESVLSSTKQDNKEYTVPSFLNKLFADLSGCTGGAIDCFVSEKNGNLVVVNRKDIKVSGGTTISLYSKDSPVKSVNMASNLDSEMAAMAFAGVNGTYTKEIMDSLFPGCTPKKEITKEAADPEADVASKKDDMGKNYNPEIVSDFKSKLKAYVNKDIKGVSMRYNIDLSLTLDGFAGVQFYQKFNISPKPSAVVGGKSTFVVGEIEHSCDGEIWDTTIVGYMMVG